MDSINVEVFLPATGKNFDFRIPFGMKVGAVASLLAESLGEQESIEILPESLMLASKDTGQILNDSQTIYEAGVRDGQSLLLI